MCRPNAPTTVATTCDTKVRRNSPTKPTEQSAAPVRRPWTVTYATSRIPGTRPIGPKLPPPRDTEVPRNERKNMLCMQIAEATRYQRALVAAGAVPPAEARTHSLPVHPPPSDSYMMLTAAPLRALVQDIHTLLGPTAPKDYRQSATSQVAQLGLYRPSTFRATAD